MLLTTGTPVMATGGFAAPCINNCISLLLYIILCLLSGNRRPQHYGVKACSWQERCSTKLDMLDQSITFATNRSLILFSLNMKQKETIGTLIGGNKTFCLLPTGFEKSPIFDQNHVPLLNITILFLKTK